MLKTLNRVSIICKTLFMKKIVVSFIFCMLAFTDIINAQTTCDGVAGVTVFGGGQSNGNNLWGIRVGLNQAYSYDITVSGNIYKLLDHNYSDPFNVTIPAGTTSYELDPYFPVPPDDGAGAEVTDVTPCPFILSEEQSEEIVQSSEFQLVFNLQNQFLDT